ncbi:MAG: family 43 glycosylhydrolase [Verrucomicrobiota bacterium JB022]|nr:family 43 glycosylhydrolase [Verrucomicrobiota bacterium JB022]
MRQPFRWFCTGLALGAAATAFAAPTIYMVGDSTMADKPKPEYPERGWGQLFKELAAPPATVENHAVNGRSTKSFIDEGRWDKVYDSLTEGDWVIIQFGHNDEKEHDPKRYAHFETTYRENLTRFVRQVRSRDAEPILATSVARRRWENGELVPTHGEYPRVVREVAAAEGVPLLEMERLTSDLERAYGEEGSKGLHLWYTAEQVPSRPDGLQDDTHYNETGAREVAAIAAREISRLHLSLADWIDYTKVKAPPPAWSADLGDGTYINPILNADYSDPDVVRVGEDYYMTASSFSHVPGLPILHSTDLVNWTLVNHALQRFPEERFAAPQHGGGVWAPSIRHHDGLFYIYYGDPDAGIFAMTAEDPAGEWSGPHLVVEGQGLIDPCPLWDTDGRVWLVHAWANSRAGIHNQLTLRELTADGLSAKNDDAPVIIDGHRLPGYRTLEGAKFYQRDGWYWVFAPAGGVPMGWQSVFRARDIRGPYEDRIVLDQGRTQVNGPHQGAWVDTPGGEHWFLHFQDRGPLGRVVHLQPMVWTEQNWPVMGTDPDGNGRGEPVRRHRKPDLKFTGYAQPPASDDFEGDTLGLQWQWQANLRPQWAELREGKLRLNAVPHTATNLWPNPALLMQKASGEAFFATVPVELSPGREAVTAGLTIFGRDYAWLGLVRGQNGTQLVHAECLQADNGKPEQRKVVLEDAPDRIWLRALWNEAGERCAFAYSVDGEAYQTLDSTFQAREGRWVGAKVGIFCTAPGASQAFAEFDSFTLAPLPGAFPYLHP